MPTPANDTNGTAARVKKLMVKHMGVAAEKVTDGAYIVNDLGADSLDVLELLMAAEDEFSIEISDEEAEKVRTVADAVALVTLKTAGRAR